MNKADKQGESEHIQSSNNKSGKTTKKIVKNLINRSEF